MISQTLRDVRKYEETVEREILQEQRPAFHLSSRTGWMNDPNGFSCYKGEYHLFYQYHPYDSHWGPMHWGHAVTKDFLHWEYLPAALAPDHMYDKDGCFSGSAVELPDGRQLLMYTGVMGEAQSDGSVNGVQRQCIAIGDGLNYTKYSGNPVLSETDLPIGGSRSDFRDPKLWKEEDGTYRCVVGNCTSDKSGMILLYSSPDGIHWKYEKILAANNNRFGKMWECPDFFELDQKQVLLVSPQDMLPKDFEYHNGNGTLCLIGSYNEETGDFQAEQDQAIDYGIDFYAPQTLLTPDGRRIMIGWMQNWDTSSQHSPKLPWFGQMSLPRELFIRNGRLFQKPVRELERMRANKVTYQNISLTGGMRLDGIYGRQIDLELILRPVETWEALHKFSLYFAQNEKYYTSLSFRPRESVLKIDRKFSGSRRALIHQRRCLVKNERGELKLRIILDRFSAEVFVNDGEYVMSTTLYTDQAADGISFFADGAVNIDVVKYDLIMG